MSHSRKLDLEEQRNPFLTSEIAFMKKKLSNYTRNIQGILYAEVKLFVRMTDK